MTLYMDVHNSLPQGATAADVAGAHAADLQVQERYGVRYLNYWVDERVGKVFCLIEAPNADAAHTVHREAHGLLADEIYPVVQGEDGREDRDEKRSKHQMKDRVHRYDAGDLGCADGLAGEFRRQMEQIPVGDVLVISTTDPAAKEDLPPLARMMGHVVRSIEAPGHGRLLVSVERGR
jgi:TusA-related sulfurtransferase